MNSSIKPLVTSLKRLVTPKPAGTAIDFEKIDEEFINYANLDTSFEPFNEEKQYLMLFIIYHLEIQLIKVQQQKLIRFSLKMHLKTLKL